MGNASGQQSAVVDDVHDGAPGQQQQQQQRRGWGRPSIAAAAAFVRSSRASASSAALLRTVSQARRNREPWQNAVLAELLGVDRFIDASWRNKFELLEAVRDDPEEVDDFLTFVTRDFGRKQDSVELVFRFRKESTANEKVLPAKLALEVIMALGELVSRNRTPLCAYDTLEIGKGKLFDPVVLQGQEGKCGVLLVPDPLLEDAEEHTFLSCFLLQPEELVLQSRWVPAIPIHAFVAADGGDGLGNPLLVNSWERESILQHPKAKTILSKNLRVKVADLARNSLRVEVTQMEFIVPDDGNEFVLILPRHETTSTLSAIEVHLEGDVLGLRTCVLESKANSAQQVIFRFLRIAEAVVRGNDALMEVEGNGSFFSSLLSRSFDALLTAPSLASDAGGADEDDVEITFSDLFSSRNSLLVVARDF